MNRSDPAYHATPFAQTRWELLATMVRPAPAAVPRPRSRWAVWASLAAHGVLVAGLVFSVAWKSSPPAALQAELWDAVPNAAAQPPLEAAAPLPEAKAAAAPEPEPEPEVIAPKVVKPPKVVAKIPPKPEPAPAIPPKDTAKERAKDLAKAQAQQAQAKEAERSKETARLAALAGGAPKVGAAQAGAVTGLGSNWGAKLKACVQPHLRFSDAGAGNPKVELTVQLLPSGSPIGARVVKASGNAVFDAAVERAIMRCDPFPRAESGGLPSSLNVIYRLNEN